MPKKLLAVFYIAIAAASVFVPSSLTAAEWTASCTDSGSPQKLVWTRETTESALFGVPVELKDINSETVTLQAMGYGDPILQMSTQTEDVYVDGELSNRFKCQVSIGNIDSGISSSGAPSIEQLVRRIEALEKRILELESEQ